MAPRDRRSPAARIRTAALLAGAMVVAAAGALQQLTAAALPLLPPRIPAHRALADSRPVPLTLTRDWKKIHLEAPVDQVTSSRSIWIDMHFDDWDRLPSDVRRRGLMRMLHRFESAMAGPPAWSEMDTADWDAIPQPIRMVVFPLMIEHWVREFAVGSAYHLPRQLMVDTVSAIVMAESWFQHRADVVNAWGNRDMGLGQCSNRCRRDLASMAEEGVLAFALAEEDYLNPWHATRVAVVWFALELARAEGDVDLAIRAYHRGFEAASRGEGTDYLNNVRRLRRKYFGPTPERSPTWQRMAAWARSSVHDPGAGPLRLAWNPPGSHSRSPDEPRPADAEQHLTADGMSDGAAAPVKTAHRTDLSGPAGTAGPGTKSP